MDDFRIKPLKGSSPNCRASQISPPRKGLIPPWPWIGFLANGEASHVQIRAANLFVHLRVFLACSPKNQHPPPRFHGFCRCTSPFRCFRHQPFWFIQGESVPPLKPPDCANKFFAWKSLCPPHPEGVLVQPVPTNIYCNPSRCVCACFNVLFPRMCRFSHKNILTCSCLVSPPEPQ